MNRLISLTILLFLTIGCAARQAPSTAAQDEWLALNRTFIDLYTRGDYEQALAVAVREVDLARGFKPGENADLATSLNNLGVTYSALGRYGEAEPPLRQALAMREKVLGPRHPEVATTLGNLGELLVARDRPAEAEEALLRALEIREGAFAADTADMAETLNNLGELYFRRNLLDEGERMLLRALAIRERELGPAHPQVARTLDILAGFVQA